MVSAAAALLTILAPWLRAQHKRRPTALAEAAANRLAAMAAGVEQPFLPTTAVPDYAGISGGDGASRRKRFVDRNGRFQQSHGSYKCVALFVCCMRVWEDAV